MPQPRGGVSNFGTRSSCVAAEAAIVETLVEEREGSFLGDQLAHGEMVIVVWTMGRRAPWNKDETIKAALTTEMETLKSTKTAQPDADQDIKAYERLERQRVRAVKEVEYLRPQLKIPDTEEAVLMDNQNFDAQRSE
ncbi:hypothetical protein Z517_09293 [Fonsecaea pedrosoi CBS 271.37]|uniref:Uncharacterized protein n=1 Tax=Fonsecaea pedrosoi CBS 271.37 TaxID=1442368 RepID=A0A0D2GWW1_9EURO|nr:uncharacterized protein Z517_09293 [Fonsecaea pedrosoi CBS 271.37]KIW76849.1 hypothetical protein Z517_09293 [Fonsecaea pedrosoi CBS 271.37]